jgi:uncharacterized protein YbjT (DUF2867 family)
MASKTIIAVFGATGAQGGGLARAILADRDSAFSVRAITRKPESEKARALAALGAEVVTGDADVASSLVPALKGAHGAFCVTNFWEHVSPEREFEQAAAMARAAKAAGVSHVVWSTLEDTRESVPLSDPRMPVLREKYNVPHFDAKGLADDVFDREGAPTSYLLAAFYWDNFILFGLGPRKGADGIATLALPLGGAKLPGIAAEDIGKCAYGIFKRGVSTVGQRFGIAGEILSGPEMADAFAKVLRQPVRFQDIPFEVYRGLGFPGADDMGNMFEWQAIRGHEFHALRDATLARQLNPALQDFSTWLSANASRVTVA